MQPREQEQRPSDVDRDLATKAGDDATTKFLVVVVVVLGMNLLHTNAAAAADAADAADAFDDVFDESRKRKTTIVVMVVVDSDIQSNDSARVDG
mmetsp:Transcript_51684/g.124758  ORF Transcript_51684/g.124758 Transcript_51684/m.124758 type:complete len:94 (-) Transcript_51684:137-418(-)